MYQLAGQGPILRTPTVDCYHQIYSHLCSMMRVTHPKEGRGGGSVVRVKSKVSVESHSETTVKSVKCLSAALKADWPL